jgi:hypothetical protein
MWLPADVLNDERISLDLWFRNHGALDFIPERLQREGFAWMLPSDQHDSKSPAQDWNPLYSFAGRPEVPRSRAILKLSQCPGYYRRQIARFGPNFNAERNWKRYYLNNHFNGAPWAQQRPLPLGSEEAVSLVPHQPSFPHLLLWRHTREE